jgi:cell division protein FtsQ
MAARALLRLHALAAPALGRIDRVSQRLANRVSKFKPRYLGVAATIGLILGSATYGMVKGDHVATVVEGLRDARDAAANAAGFGIVSLAVSGGRQLSEAEVIAAAGVTPRTSLLFLDVDDAQTRLEANPWIARATVRKLYPGHLEIAVTERDAFAVWQDNGKLFVIAADGTVLGPLGERKVTGLPLVVGPGAAKRARDIVGALDAQPALREDLRAAVLVAERRWNLKLKSGLDIRLPETGLDVALATLAGLDRDRKILSRDLTAIDLRLPDRVTVRLSDDAAQAREQAAKDAKKKKGGPV